MDGSGAGAMAALMKAMPGAPGVAGMPGMPSALPVAKGGKKATRKMKKSPASKSTRKVKAVGSKAEVFHGTAVHTSGGLHKHHLMKTRKGRIVSKKKHALGKKAVNRLFKAGYKPKKGTFKLFK
jgi:hypothetical protein